MKLPNGTIFRFTNLEARGREFVKGEWDQLCVVLFDGESAPNGHYRRLACRGLTTGCAVKNLPLEHIGLVGIMPKDRVGAISWDDSFAFPHDMKPGTVFQFKTKPKWWTCEDWSGRMVVMFSEPSAENWVHVRRMSAMCSYHSFWDPRKDEFEVVGHLTPDQLHTTDSTVGLKPEAAEETVDEAVEAFTFPKVVDPRFTEGTVFCLTGKKKPDWWHADQDEWNKPCVVVDLNKSHDGAVPFRRLSEHIVFDLFKFFPDVDAFEIIGQLPSGKLDSMDLDDVIRLPMQPQQLDLTLAIGTKFRFNNIPERWHRGTNAKIGDIFSVIEDCRFSGTGQCISRVEHDPVWWHPNDGVLPTDDISIIEPEQLSLGTRFRFTEIPDRWDYIPQWVSTHTEFAVIKYDTFHGAGQCIASVKNGKEEGLYSLTNGVLLSDDIEILDKSSDEVEDDYPSVADLHARIASLSKENGELKAVNWKSTAEKLEKQLQEQKKTIDNDTDVNGRLCMDLDELRGVLDSLKKRVQELEKENGLLKGSVSDWMASYYEAHRTIKKLGEKKPNAALAFLKKIW